MLQNKDEKSFIHNHLTFLVKYHKDETADLSRIVGFEVKPFRFVLVMLVIFYLYDMMFFYMLTLSCLLTSSLLNFSCQYQSPV
jgi:hypothetical protein